MRLIKITILVLLIFLTRAWADPASQQAVSKFVSADYHYKQGQFGDAIKEYEGILSMGLESGPLYYNLGSAYYKNGDLGKALLNYKRAEGFIPRDSDLKFNKNLVIDQLALGNITSPNLLERLFAKHEEFYTKDEMAFILTVLGGVILLMYLFLTFIKPVKSRWIFMIILLFVFFIYLIGFILKVDNETNRAMVINTTAANYEPLEKSTAYYQLKEGEEVKLLREDNGWFKIKRYDGKLGWVPKQNIELF